MDVVVKSEAINNVNVLSTTIQICCFELGASCMILDAAKRVTTSSVSRSVFCV